MLWCLYELYVSDWAVGDLGFAIKNYVQSMMLTTLLNVCLKLLGKNFRMTADDGHFNIGPNTICIKLTHVVTIWEILDSDTPKMSASVKVNKAGRILTRVKMNS